MNGEYLYRKYLSGDKSAFDEIVELYRDNLIFFINRYTHNLDTSEDISQDSFMELLLNPTKFDFRVSLKTYLFTVGRNKALNHIKKQDRMFCSDNIDLSLKSDSYISFENEILASEDKKALHNSIDKLRDDYSTVLHLIYFEEMSYAQAGAVMNKSRKQVENLVMRARTTLRILLEKEGYSK